MLPLASFAQQRLTLQDAIAAVLRHNFDIQMYDIAAQQAKRNNTIGNAGMLPNVFVGATLTGTNNNTHSDLSNGTQQNNAHATSENVNPAATFSWTVFDGGKMFIVKKQLNELERIGEIQFKAQIQAMVSRTIQVYAQVVWQYQQLIAIDTALALAKTRMYISDVKYKTGAGPKVDYLQAHVDYNARESDSLNTRSALAYSFDSLRVLMGESREIDYVVDDSLQLNTALQPLDQQRLTDINLTVDVYKRNATVSGLNARIVRTFQLPNVSLNGGYYYSRTTNATGFSLFNQSYGPSGTVSLSIPVFEGGNLRRQVKVASLQAWRDELLYEKMNTVIARQYRSAWRNYQVSVAAYKLESENIKYAKENLDVQLARFRLGVGTTLESRQAENDYVAALEVLYTAAYNLKVNETIVLELENKLVTN